MPCFSMNIYQSWDSSQSNNVRRFITAWRHGAEIFLMQLFERFMNKSQFASNERMKTSHDKFMEWGDERLPLLFIVIKIRIPSSLVCMCVFTIWRLRLTDCGCMLAKSGVKVKLSFFVKKWKLIWSCRFIQLLLKWDKGNERRLFSFQWGGVVLLRGGSRHTAGWFRGDASPVSRLEMIFFSTSPPTLPNQHLMELLYSRAAQGTSESEIFLLTGCLVLEGSIASAASILGDTWRLNCDICWPL